MSDYMIDVRAAFLTSEQQERWVPDELGLVHQLRWATRDESGRITSATMWAPTGMVLNKPLVRLSWWEKFCGWLK